MATQEETDARYMRMALEEARAALQADEVPIGAIVVANGQVIGRGHNMTETLGDVTAHAEMLAITAATQTINGKYLTGATLYVTVEPCLMCAGAIAWSQLTRIVYGAPDPKRGYTFYLTPPAPKEPTEPEKTGKTGKAAATEQAQKTVKANVTNKAEEVKPRPAHPFHPKATITPGVLAEDCANLMRNFFRTKR
ncbi:MAG: nucleoside deaminase [Barnesiella sp.]|nr:nucleoside deaminase [Barnesiella sp.]